MRNQTDQFLAGDWVVLGMHVPNWAVVLAGLVLVALLVAWLERPRRTPATNHYEASPLSNRSASRPT